MALMHIGSAESLRDTLTYGKDHRRATGDNFIDLARSIIDPYVNIVLN